MPRSLIAPIAGGWSSTSTQRSLADALFDSMRDGLAVRDPKDRLVRVNPALCRMTGFGEEELLGATFPYPFWRDETIAQAERALVRSRERDGEFELSLQRKDGESLPVLVRTSRLLDANGKTRLHLAIFSELASLDRAREDVHDARSLIAIALDESGAGVVVADRHGTVTLANEGAYQLRDSSEPLVGTRVEQHAHSMRLYDTQLRPLAAHETPLYRALEERLTTSEAGCS